MKKSRLMLKLWLASDPKLLCAVRAAMGEIARISGFPEAEARSIVLAVDEALANVIRHAYGGSLDQPIQVAFYQGRRGAAQTLEIRIVDRGTPVVPEQLVGRPLDEVRPGGLGLHFIREIMDSVTFRHAGGRNYLRLIKSVTPAASNGNALPSDIQKEE